MGKGKFIALCALAAAYAAPASAATVFNFDAAFDGGSAPGADALYGVTSGKYTATGKSYLTYTGVTSPALPVGTSYQAQVSGYTYTALSNNQLTDLNLTALSVSSTGNKRGLGVCSEGSLAGTSGDACRQLDGTGTKEALWLNLVTNSGTAKPVTFASATFTLEGATNDNVNIFGVTNNVLSLLKTVTFSSSGLVSFTPELGAPIGFSSYVFTNSAGDGVRLRSATFNSVAAVPEPGQWAMLIVGFGLIGANMRRRTRMTMVTA